MSLIFIQTFSLYFYLVGLLRCPIRRDEEIITKGLVFSSVLVVMEKPLTNPLVNAVRSTPD